MSSPTASTRTLVVALLANLGIAVSKFVAAAITGSSAMLTEGVHSVVDCTNQLLLLWGRRAARPPDMLHPLGYGRELYFWSFVVAVLVFALGAGVSIYEGIVHIANPEEAGSPIVAYIVLLIAFLLDGWSTLDAFWEFKAGKGELGWFEAIRQSKDPAGFHRAARKRRRNGRHCRCCGRIGDRAAYWRPFLRRCRIGCDRNLLGLTAFVLAFESKGLLIGEALIRSWSRICGSSSAASRAWPA